jgi:16S rRNA (guanine(1405)-N(7))-methyltransferase
MNDPEGILQSLVDEVRSTSKYSTITPELVRKLCREALNKGLQGKSAVKAVRSKLHQVGSAYFRRKIDFQEAERHLTDLPEDMQSELARQFCTRIMQAHASTAERLTILPEFFQTCLSPVSPVREILDLACGLNPLALPWMPLEEGFVYRCCDIYTNMVTFLQSFFDHFHINGTAVPCSLSSEIPAIKTQVAFLLKSIPCLEQLDKALPLKLLEAVQAEHILVSFPVRSLGGKKKGMAGFYKEHFLETVAVKHWTVQEFIFSTEIAFLVSK